MSGNTKFLGFTNDGKILLERWGGKEAVEVSKESLKVLRAACFEALPKKPEQKKDSDVGFSVNYNERVGLITMNMSPAAARELACFLTLAVSGKGALSEAWVRPIMDAVDAHEKYVSPDEPGVP